MKNRLIFSVFMILLLAPAFGTQAAAATNDPTIAPAISWLEAQQQPDGGFKGFSGKTDPGATADIALALASTGANLANLNDGGPSVTGYLQAQAKTYAANVGGAAKLILAAVASGQNPRDFGGQDLVRDILSHQDHSSGLFDSQIYVHAYAMLALAAAGQTIPTSAIDGLISHQAADGGWAYTGETAAGKADSNTTAIAVQALVASGEGSSPAVAKGMNYLNGLKASDGSFAYQPSSGSPLVGDANSTALVIQALLATGKAVDSTDVTSAVDALDKFDNIKSGAFFYRSDATADNLLATAQALPALEGKPLPVWPSKTPGRTLDQAKLKSTPGDPQRCIYFQQTGHNACQGFLAYWQHFGGVQVFGYPLTEEFTYVDPTTGKPTTMQYFERARFEWHPGSAPARYDVELGLLGAEQLNTP